MQPSRLLLTQNRRGVLSHVRLAGTVVAAVAVSGLYLLFVVHYSTNVLYQDDWSVVPLVHASLHGSLTLGALWALHNQNRMFVPNLTYVGLGVLTHDNTSVVTVLSAIMFALTFAICLASLRFYLGRALSPLTVLVLGVVWFSIIDWQNALWAFQFAWYLILFLLIAMIYCLQRRSFAVALVIAVLRIVFLLPRSGTLARGRHYAHVERRPVEQASVHLEWDGGGDRGRLLLELQLPVPPDTLATVECRVLSRRAG